MIYVSSMSRVNEVVRNTGALHLVSLLNEATPFERPETISPTNHLFLSMNDIAVEQVGMTAPGVEHVEALLNFVHIWDRAQPLVINCFAGISRSTAAAYIAAAALMPEKNEEDLAFMLRNLSPSATPNPMLVRHADALLKRNGRMISAIESIGRGADAFEGTPFALNVS